VVPAKLAPRISPEGALLLEALPFECGETAWRGYPIRGWSRRNRSTWRDVQISVLRHHILPRFGRR
jgi:hypothetical protein